MDASRLVVRGADLSDQLVRAFAAYYKQAPEIVRARKQIALRSLDMHATDEEYDRLAKIATRLDPEPAGEVNT